MHRAAADSCPDSLPTPQKPELKVLIRCLQTLQKAGGTVSKFFVANRPQTSEVIENMVGA